MNIYKRELRAHRKSLLIWIISLLVLIIAGMSKYSAFTESDSGVNEMLANMPKTLQNLFGFGVFDFSIAIHYYGILFMYIALLVTFHAITLGAGIIAKEERDKTSEFLFTKPISREKILTYKILAALSMLLVVSVTNFLFTFMTLSYYAKEQSFIKELFYISIALLIMQLMFLFIGFFLASFMKTYKKASAVCSSILLTMFFLSIVADIMPNMTFLKWFTIFQYYNAKDILIDKMNIGFIVISVIILVSSVIGTYHFYKKRDLNI